MKFFIVEDSKVFAALIQQLLEDAGHEVRALTESAQALEAIRAFAPDCVVLDSMLPDTDGFSLLGKLRADPAFKSTKIIVASSKPYEADRNRALELGADGYINKVVERDNLLDRVMELTNGSALVTFWGVRGTLPAPGDKTVRYGGNTSCISVQWADGRTFVLDAGSGIKALSRHLTNARRNPMKAKIFISHPHWDHINALPFFGPLYVAGNEFEILGPAQETHTVAQLISAQMDGVFFPVTVNEFAASVSYRDLPEGEFDIDGVRVSAMLLSHPGNCLGYRIEHNGMSMCYVTDNELYPESTPYYNAEYRDKLIKFVSGCDALVTDSTYMDEDYPSKIHWGHSAISEVVNLAHAAKVKTLYLFHHDPEQDDNDIDEKLLVARARLRELDSKTAVLAPSEGYQFRLG